MKSKKYRRCLSFICAAALVSALIYSPAGRFVAPYSAGVSVQAEGEVVPEGTKTQAMGILLTLLLGNGFRMVGSFADQANGLGNLFDQWIAETQATITAGAIVLGTRFQNGWMQLTSDVTNAYNSFASWLADTFSIPTTGTTDITVAVGTTGYIYNVADAISVGSYVRNGYTNYRSIIAEGNFDLIAAKVDSTNNDLGYGYYYIRSTTNISPKEHLIQYKPDGSLNTESNSSFTASGTYTANNITYYLYRKTPGFTGAVEGGLTNILNVGDSYPVVANTIAPLFEDNLTLDDQILTGESLDLKDGINLDDDQALLLDLSALASYAGVLDQTLTSAEDLIGALTNAIDRSKAEADEDEDAEVVPWDLVDTDTDSKVAPDDITETPPNETGMYKTLGLEKVFPFSIPFDIYYFIKMFNATAQAPEFDIPFVVTGVINERYHVDLSMFDTVAAIFRTMMLVGFIWFLITKTRDFLRS